MKSRRVIVEVTKSYAVDINAEDNQKCSFGCEHYHEYVCPSNGSMAECTLYGNAHLEDGLRCDFCYLQAP